MMMMMMMIETLEIYKYTQNFNQEDKFRLGKPWLHLFPHTIHSFTISEQ
jgi:hypothetical protein